MHSSYMSVTERAQTSQIEWVKEMRVLIPTQEFVLRPKNEIVVFSHQTVLQHLEVTNKNRSKFREF